MSATPSIKLDIREAIATITLNRPDALNALSRPMIGEIIAVLDRLDADDNVRAVIFTGAGRAFCAGADLSGDGADTFDYDRREGETYGPSDGPPRDWGGLLTLRLFSFLKPVIAAVNGPAVGVGVTMQLPMDVRLASTTARFGFVFARLGIAPEAASSWFLPRIVGVSRALDWCYSGRLVPAREALDSGLVHALHEPDALLEAAHELALTYCRHSAPVSVALTRQMMWRMMTAPHPMHAHRADSRAVHARGRSADAREGVAAFLEKRTANFTDTVSGDLPDIFPGWTDPPFD